MSMSLFVVLALGMEPNTDVLNEYSKDNGLKVEYSKNINLNEHSGFLPAKIGEVEAGVEVYSFSVSKLPEPFKSIVPANLSEGVVYQFRFGGNPIELKTAFTSALILNGKYGGVSFDDKSGNIMSIDQINKALSYFGGM